MDASYETLLDSLAGVSPPVFVAAMVLTVGYFRGANLAILTLITFAWVIFTGLWDYTIQTVAFMLVGILASFVFGLILGVLGSIGPKTNAAVRIMLDAMQAFPAFAYFVPVVFLFGMGNTAALVVTVIWALPPLARMTSVGLRNVSPEVLEAAVSVGANRWQILSGVKLPMAAPSMRAGTNQMIMYVISMATMSAMIGASGLGAPVWSGLSRLAFGDALEGGIALVLLAIVVDRATSPRHKTLKRPHSGDTTSSRRLRSLRFFSARFGMGHAFGLVLLMTVTATQVFRGPWQNFAKPSWGTPLSLREPVDGAVQWLTIVLGPTLDSFTAVIQQYGLNVLGNFFGAIPWLAVLLSTAVLGTILAGRYMGLLLGIGVLLIGCLGMWESTAQTLAVVTTALGLVIIIGFPLGVLMGTSKIVASIMRPILDVWQTLPVYLLVIPAVMVLGTGEVAAVFATFVAAAPPMIRYTNAALRGADTEVVEAALIFGASPGQILRQIRIPMGLQTIMVGLNQSLLMALAMAVVSAMIGAPGLGGDILMSVERANLSLGIEAGLAMFLLGVILDRLFDGSARFVASARHSSVTIGKAA